MKVAIVIYSLDVRGGTHKQVLRLCEYLAKQQIHFAIYTNYYDGGKTYPEFENFEIHARYKSKQEMENSLCRQRSGKGTIRHIVNRVAAEINFLKMIPKDVDVINVHDLEFHLLMALAKLFRRCKVVWQINDLPMCYMVGNASYIPYEKGFERQRRKFRRYAQFVDTITVNVTKNAELVHSCLGRDAKVLYCGVDENHSLVRHTYSLRDRKVNLLSTGVFFPYRNYEALVRAVKQLTAKGFQVHLDIIGATDWDKVYSQKIIDMIKEQQLDGNITIWGQVDEKKYAELYNKADIFAFVNINQSWGLAVFEAMSCGLPVIVSNSVGAIELLHNGKDSIIVDPENVEEICAVIEKLCEEPDYYAAISDAAADAVKGFTWDELYSSKMVEIFKGLLNGTRGS